MKRKTLLSKRIPSNACIMLLAFPGSTAKFARSNSLQDLPAKTGVPGRTAKMARTEETAREASRERMAGLVLVVVSAGLVDPERMARMGPSALVAPLGPRARAAFQVSMAPLANQDHRELQVVRARQALQAKTDATVCEVPLVPAAHVARLAPWVPKGTLVWLVAMVETVTPVFPAGME